MQKRRFIPLLLAFLFAVAVQAQTEGGQQKEARTGTWSIYAQGGLSWAGGVWYPNVDAKQSYNQSPAVGGGVDPPPQRRGRKRRIRGLEMNEGVEPSAEKSGESEQ